MKEQEKLKNILTVLAILLIVVLLGLLIYSFWSKPQSDVPTILPNKPDDMVVTNTIINIDKDTLKIANDLYNKGTDIWMGISSRNADEMFEKDSNEDYLNILHDYTFTNTHGVMETTKDYIFYQFKDGVITNIFSSTGIKNLINNSNEKFLYLNNHYYYADSWIPSSMARITLSATSKTDNEIIFKVTNNYNDKITEFVIEKENDTWKIKKYEWIFN